MEWSEQRWLRVGMEKAPDREVARLVWHIRAFVHPVGGQTLPPIGSAAGRPQTRAKEKAVSRRQLPYGLQTNETAANENRSEQNEPTL